MNLVIENAEEFSSPDVVTSLGTIVIRGNSVVQLECLDRVWGFKCKLFLILTNYITFISSKKKGMHEMLPYIPLKYPLSSLSD